MIISRALRADLPPLIYVGQAGATSSRSRSKRSATLGSRIAGNHLRGNISSSTFRKTLAAVLVEPLGLRLVRPGSLDKESNQSLSSWISEHLSVAIAPVLDREDLADVEQAVLRILDPPLNMMHMSPTPVRTRLAELRAQLS